VPKKIGHNEECWLGQAIKGLEQAKSLYLKLESRVEGLKVNRDALVEENARFRSVVVTDVEIIKEQAAKIAELERIVVEAKACVKIDQERAAVLRLKVEEANAECISTMGTCARVLKELKEFKSIHEGKMDAAHEVITQLKAKIELQTAAKDFRIEIIQMSGDIYYWALMCKDVQLAHSREIDAKDIIEPEADAVAAQLNLPVVVNERK